MSTAHARSVKRYRQRNPQKVRQWQKDYYEKHPEVYSHARKQYQTNTKAAIAYIQENYDLDWRKVVRNFFGVETK